MDRGAWRATVHGESHGRGAWWATVHGESHGQRSLVGYSPWRIPWQRSLVGYSPQAAESEATERTAHTQGVLAPSSGLLTPIYFFKFLTMPPVGS